MGYLFRFNLLSGKNFVWHLSLLPTQDHFPNESLMLLARVQPPKKKAEF
jgi:hypothetical protein